MKEDSLAHVQLLVYQNSNRLIINKILVNNLQSQVYNKMQEVRQVFEVLQKYVHRQNFWYYHGVILTGLWVFLSAMAIIAKSFSIQIHLLLFTFINIFTFFLTGVAFFYLIPDFHNFLSWSLAKQLHVVAGMSFVVLLIYQHYLGVRAFMKKTKSPKHVSMGKYLVSFARAIAALGWILVDNIQNAILIAFASLPILIISLMSPPQKPLLQNNLPRNDDKNKGEARQQSKNRNKPNYNKKKN